MGEDQGTCKVDYSKFQDAEFQRGEILIKAGLNRKPLPMVTSEVKHANKKKDFAKFGLSEAWVGKCVTNIQQNDPGLKRTTLVKELLGYVRSACDGEIPFDDATEVTAEHDDNYDPMEEIQVEGSSLDANMSGRKKRKRTAETKANGRFLTVEMPEICPELDPQSKARRKVLLLVYRKDQVWISFDDVNWAMRYLYAQYCLKGVAHVPADDGGPQCDSP